MWENLDIDIKNFTVSQLKNTTCNHNLNVYDFTQPNSNLPVAVQVHVVLRDGRHQELRGRRRGRGPVRRRLLVLRGQDWNLIGDPTVGGFLRDGPLDQVEVLEVDAIVLFFSQFISIKRKLEFFFCTHIYIIVTTATHCVTDK